jgi:hypothetical protein
MANAGHDADMLAAPRTIALLATLAGLVACSVAAPGGGTSPMPP